MSSSDQKLFCEVYFRDFRKNKIIRANGKITIDNLISPKNKFIDIENSIFQNQHWKKLSCRIPKVDIIKIYAYKTQLILNYDKGVLVVDENSMENKTGQSKKKFKSINALI